MTTTRQEIIDCLTSQVGYFFADEAERIADALADKSDATKILLRALDAGDYTDENRAKLADIITRADSPVQAYVDVVVVDSGWAGQSVAGPWADAIVQAAR